MTSPSQTIQAESAPYVGRELELFAEAVNWKSYWTSHVRPLMRGNVLEVGAGAGVNTNLLLNPKVNRWTCLEPDAQLAMQCRQTLGPIENRPVDIVVGTTQTLASHTSFDVALYVDVLEHVQDDRQELQRAARLLRSGGHLIVLSPAHPMLFSPFDRALGHYRRYTRKALIDAAPRELRLIKWMQLDSVGMGASLANRFLLKQVIPTPQQLRFWDRCLVRISRVIDPLLRYRLGRSILAIWDV